MYSGLVAHLPPLFVDLALVGYLAQSVSILHLSGVFLDLLGLEEAFEFLLEGALVVLWDTVVEL